MVSFAPDYEYMIFSDWVIDRFGCSGFGLDGVKRRSSRVEKYYHECGRRRVMLWYRLVRSYVYMSLLFMNPVF